MTERNGRSALVVSVPVLLIDDLFPRLKDTELRVLLVLMRQLHVMGRERETTWLTHREMCRRTGRASEAVSGAISALVERGLLDVFDSAGRLLKTPEARQHASGQRFYRLSLRMGKDSEALFRRPGTDKPKTIEDRKENSYSFRFSDRTEDERGRIEEAKERIRQRLAQIPRSGASKPTGQATRIVV
jgi:hypothetical protein